MVNSGWLDKIIEQLFIWRNLPDIVKSYGILREPKIRLLSIQRQVLITHYFYLNGN